jgi:hypothetical protein
MQEKYIQTLLNEIENMFDAILDKTYFIGIKYGIEDEFKDIMKNLIRKINSIR